MKNKIVAVNGNPEYGQELIDTLIGMGGVNLQGLAGKNEGCLYYIDPDSKTVMSEFDNEITSEEFDVITLQELKKQLMELKPIQKINLDEGNYDKEVEIELGNDHEAIIENGKIKIIKKLYPYTFQECCEILRICPGGELQYDYDIDDPSSKFDTKYEDALVDKLDAFRKLIICRDAYWKTIDWKPDMHDNNTERYVITYDIVEEKLKTNVAYVPFVLMFPDKNMADVFMKKFESLIIKCKEWI